MGGHVGAEFCRDGGGGVEMPGLAASAGDDDDEHSVMQQQRQHDDAENPNMAAELDIHKQESEEDFEAWRSSLTHEEQELAQTQAAGEFNKRFRKSEEFKKDLPEEKVKSFSKVLGKFFDAEAADYKKDVATKVSNYSRLLEKAGDKVLDFKMKIRVVETDRNADRRYTLVTCRIKERAQKGEKFPQSSPMKEVWEFANDDADFHEAPKKVMEVVKKSAVAAEMDVPPMGEKLRVHLPMQLVNQLRIVNNYLVDSLETFKENHTEVEVEAFAKDLQAAFPKVVGNLAQQYLSARDELEEDDKLIKSCVRLQTVDKYKTKADVVRLPWAGLEKFMGKPRPPVDEEFLAELEEVPAVQEGEFKYNWGIVDKLYKSEAIDAFGMKYLLGAFDIKEEAQKVFKEWNDEHEEACADMKSGDDQISFKKKMCEKTVTEPLSQGIGASGSA